jgi:hypothetical protein
MNYLKGYKDFILKGKSEAGPGIKSLLNSAFSICESVGQHSKPEKR